MVLVVCALLQVSGVESAVLENRYQDAVEILRSEAKEAARRGDRGELEEISLRVKEIRSLEREYRKVRSYDGKDDPKAYRLVGRFECFVKGAWERGLPLLAKSDDAFLSVLAQAELDGQDPLKIADSWWTGSTKIEGSLGLTGATGTVKERIDRKTMVFWRSQIEDRALQFYEKAWPSLAGADRERVRKLCLEKLGALKPLPAKGDASDWRPFWAHWCAALAEGVAKDGKKSVSYIPCDGKNETGFSAIQSLPIEVIPGQEYSATAWVLAPGIGSSGIFEIRFFDSEKGTVRGFISNFDLDYPFWQKVTVKAVAPAESKYAAVDVRAKIAEGRMFADHASLRGPTGEILKNGSFER